MYTVPGLHTKNMHSKTFAWRFHTVNLWGIIGHTGSGKSTLIQHLNGLVKATDGALYYNGENIYQNGYDMRALRNQVGLVFQYPEYQLFEIDVLTDVCFGPKKTRD